MQSGGLSAIHKERLKKQRMDEAQGIFLKVSPFVEAIKSFTLDDLTVLHSLEKDIQAELHVGNKKNLFGKYLVVFNKYNDAYEAAKSASAISYSESHLEHPELKAAAALIKDTLATEEDIKRLTLFNEALKSEFADSLNLYALAQDLNRLCIDMEQFRIKDFHDNFTEVDKKFIILRSKGLASRIRVLKRKLEASNPISNKETLVKKLDLAVAKLDSLLENLFSIPSECDTNFLLPASDAVFEVKNACEDAIRKILGRFPDLDPMLNEKFFACDVENDSIDVDFSLPQSAETLRTFFASPEGVAFKKGCTETIDKLSAWSEKNGLNTSALEKFKEDYITNYSDDDDKINEVNFSLYQEGFPALVGILKLIESGPSTPSYLETCKQTMANLISQIVVCGPGSYKHNSTAYFHLLSQSNLSVLLQTTRTQIAEQLALEILRKYNVPKNMEIHYVTAILNHFSATLNIKKIEDDYIDQCNPVVIRRALAEFTQELPKKLTADFILKTFVSETGLERTVTALNKTPAKAAFTYECFESELKRCGSDNKFYKSENVFEIINDECTEFRTSWKSIYTLYLSLFERLRAGNYLIPIDERRCQLNNNDVLFYLPARSLQYSYVYAPAAKQHEKYQPFLPYCIDALLSENETLKTELLTFLTSKKMTESQRFNIVEGVVCYLKSEEHKTSAQQEKELIYLINEVVLKLLPAWTAQ